MIEAISHLIHRDYEAIVQDFITLRFIPRGEMSPGLRNCPLFPVFHTSQLSNRMSCESHVTHISAGLQALI